MSKLLRADLVTSSDIEHMNFPQPKEEIIIKETRGRKKRKITGTVVEDYDSFIAVKIDGKKLKENFLKVDFITGDLVLV